ncbi:hypothetical protein SKAU_G00299660 [Synaphobranchus kaupii]|uniref:AIG1-type G domain-containing protein n=1 Tax=Synaphobranchus kaupii TaxID=118154 RepID=A0A9Q1EVH0_SYNKA|nr:hypothetical protein SKAU_G00299660 [Synaphobranchus kaupii]
MSVLRVVSCEKDDGESGSDAAATVSSSAPHGHDLAFPKVSELRMLLLGERESGRSAVGNAILGRRAFGDVGARTRRSAKAQGMAAGRRVTVVDTPGWEWFPFHGALRETEREMVRGATLCSPGPHALLLIIPLSFTFRAREQRAVEEHLRLFGESAWRHALVLFIVGPDGLRDSTVEEEIEESEFLQGLVARCGNRFHALHGGSRRGRDPIAELLGKVENMVTTNGGAFIPTEEVLKEARERGEAQARDEEELARVKKALEDLEQGDSIVKEDGKEDDEESTGQRKKEAAKNLSSDGKNQQSLV